MRLAYAFFSLLTGIPFAAIAAAVLPMRVPVSRLALLGIGVAAGVIGFVAAIAGGLLGPLAAAASAFVFVFSYDRLSRRPAR